MSIERDRFRYVCRVMILWLGAFLAWGLAVAARPGPVDFSLALLGGVGLTLGVGWVERRWRAARVAAGRPVDWTGPGPSPEAEGFARFAAWLGTCFLWLPFGGALAFPGVEPVAIVAGGWLALTLGWYAHAVRWMIAPGRPDAHEDELAPFALGLLVPVAYPLVAAAITSEAARYPLLVVTTMAAAPLAIAWHLRRGRRLAPSREAPALAPGGAPLPAPAGAD